MLGQNGPPSGITQVIGLGEEQSELAQVIQNDDFLETFGLLELNEYRLAG